MIRNGELGADITSNKFFSFLFSPFLVPLKNLYIYISTYISIYIYIWTEGGLGYCTTPNNVKNYCCIWLYLFIYF